MNLELKTCFDRCRGPLLVVGALSGGSNVLALTGSIFMLAVYDRVIPSGSVPTLVALGIMGFLAYSLQAMIDIFRGKMLTRVGLLFKETLGPRVYDIAVRNAVTGDYRSGTASRDLDQVQSFLSSMGPTALFDLPWLPIYLSICFFFHPVVGIIVTCGALLLIFLTFISNVLTKGPSNELNEAVNRRNAFLSESQVRAETLRSMGMTLNLSAVWNSIGEKVIHTNRRIADASTTLSTISRVARMMLQSFVLATGAYLVMQGNASGGIMIASSILSARALAPIELTISHWKNFVAARQSWTRLDTLFTSTPPERVAFSPPLPVSDMQCETLTLALTRERRILVRDVNFRLSAGQSLAIVGPTGSGKSTLARALVGLWEPSMGAVRLDGMSLSDWSALDRGRFIGYLPQNVTLFEGTIAANISRFDPNADSAEIVHVAKAAGVHELISRLPDGYETMIGESGGGLSGGQSQRIGLARALYGNPFLVVLDEPNSNLDNDGDVALGRAMNGIRERGGIAIIITHRPSILTTIDQVLLMSEGRVQKFGARDEVLEYLRRPKAVPSINAA